MATQAVYEGRAIVSNLVNTGLLLIVSASFVDPWVPAPAAIGSDLRDFHRDAGEFVNEWTQIDRIHAGYRVAVNSLRCYLLEVNHWLQRAEAENASAITEIFCSYDGLIGHAGPLLEKLRELNEQFQDVAKLVCEEELPVHRAFAQRELHPLIMSSPYPHRTFNKPLGYAGDYEMMNMTHRDIPEGPSAYAKLVNAAYTRLPIALCVRNRARLLQAYLDEGTEHALGQDRIFAAISVGCGPAIEVQRFVAENPNAGNAELHLMDFNKETLCHARAQLEQIIATKYEKPDLVFLHKSIHDLLKNAVTTAA